VDEIEFYNSLPDIHQFGIPDKATLCSLSDRSLSATKPQKYPEISGTQAHKKYKMRCRYQAAYR
jgi:hypothetical protein